MTIDDFTHILNQIEPYTRYIYLHVQGEPLMHPLLNEFIILAKKNLFNIQIVTNGTLLNKSDFLLQGNIRKISFSLHSIDYSNIDINTYYDNIINFCKTASIYNNLYCELRFNNEDTMGVRSTILLNKLKSDFNFNTTSRNKSYKIMNKVYVSFSSLFEWPSLENNYVGKDGYCHGGIDMISILSNGIVSACCLDAQGDINLGNIYKDSLSEILKSEKYLNIVEGFKNKKAIEPLCQHCSYRLRFD